MANKFYAVKKGKKPGIYLTWDEAKTQVNGFSGAQYKSFKTKSEAEEFMKPKAAKKMVKSSGNSSHIQLFSDGGSRNHGNKKGQHVKDDDKAAWAYLIIKDGKKKSDSAGEWGATNNKMEVLGLVNALCYVLSQGWENEPIDAILDSKYVLNSITQHWLAGWKRRGWKKSDGTVIKNKAEFMQLAELLPKFSQLSFSWTKGHAINEGNNFVDELLNKTMDKMTKSSNSVKKTPVKPKAVNKTSAMKEKTTPKQDSKYVDTKASVSAIRKNLEQLGLFDK